MAANTVQFAQPTHFTLHLLKKSTEKRLKTEPDFVFNLTLKVGS